jgi:hypothetical protein
MACNWMNWTGMGTHYRGSVSRTGIETYMISYFNFEMNDINLNAFITCAVWRTFLLIWQIGHCHGMFLMWVKHMTVMGVLHSLLKPSALTGEVTTTSMQFVRWACLPESFIGLCLIQLNWLIKQTVQMKPELNFKTNPSYEGFEILTAVVMKISVFCDTMSYILLKVNQCFGQWVDMLVSCLTYYSTLKMEEAYSSKTWVDVEQTTWH